MGEDITETLEVIPRRWKVIQTVREKFSCRDCERISQPPAPFHPTPRGWAGPSLLAMIIFEKYGQHQPLNRQAERYAREGVELSLSTLADQVGAVAAALAPLHALIEAHVMAAERLHGDDTTVPLLAKGKTETARLWTYVRDDRPFGGPAPPAALFRFSRDRRGAHPRQHLTGWSGVLQADAYAGFNALFAETREPGPILPAFCWAHARRKFFELADIAANARRGKKATPISPLALEAVKRIDAIFDLERAINGLPAEQRLATRKAEIAPLVADLHAWMTAERARLSKHAPVAKAMSYMLPRWDDFARFLDDGRVCLTNNAAERSLRGAALGRKAWLFAGSERGGHRAAFMYTLIVTAKLNGADPQAWLADVLAPHRQHADEPTRRTAPLELGRCPEKPRRQGSLTAVPAVGLRIVQAECAGTDHLGRIANPAMKVPRGGCSSGRSTGRRQHGADDDCDRIGHGTNPGEGQGQENRPLGCGQSFPENSAWPGFSRKSWQQRSSPRCCRPPVPQSRRPRPLPRPRPCRTP